MLERCLIFLENLLKNMIELFERIVNKLLEMYGSNLLYVSILNTTRQPSLMSDLELLIILESYTDNVIEECSKIRRTLLNDVGICVEPYVYSIDDVCKIFESRRLMLSILGGIMPLYQDGRFNIRRILCECAIPMTSSPYVDAVREILCS